MPGLGWAHLGDDGANLREGGHQQVSNALTPISNPLVCRPWPADLGVSLDELAFTYTGHATRPRGTHMAHYMCQLHLPVVRDLLVGGVPHLVL